MTYYEKKLLRKWVMDGHNPRESLGSRYFCMTGSEPMDFLDVKMEFGSRIGVNKSQAVPGWVVGRKATLLFQLVACVL
ncbi:hypothetical protein [Butyrivibrio proteoclasticus]|uniref:hypothetical protein n=1 Tax=Butyrivibrio proteoclasticus TaxID=43305 RepID=UPI00047B0693|nr:hypothetical protein [Butyrivibrio proteoclasticus]